MIVRDTSGKLKSINMNTFKNDKLYNYSIYLFKFKNYTSEKFKTTDLIKSSKDNYYSEYLLNNFLEESSNNTKRKKN
jgi:hypothetical protein